MMPPFEKPDDNQVTGLFVQLGGRLRTILLATLCGVAPAVFADDCLFFCVTENYCAVFGGVSLCVCHAGLLLIVVSTYISR
jgi:hypothetical protein